MVMLNMMCGEETLCSCPIIRRGKLKRETLIEGEKTEQDKEEKIKHRKGKWERTNEESNPRIHNGSMV
jgi:hypothetical protein